MKVFLLDTYVPSEILRPFPEPRVADWLRNQSREELFVSVITIGELRRGTELLPHGTRRMRLETFIDGELTLWFEPRILPVTRAIAERWGKMDGLRQRAGRPLNTADGLIAATAYEHGFTLVTRNLRDFMDLEIALFNPWEG